MREKKRRLDLFLAGVFRSGTTALVASVHRPPEQVMLSEPCLFREDRWRRFAANFENARLYGCKEVVGELVIRTLNAFEIKHVIVVVRDLRHAIASAYEWWKHGHPTSPEKVRQIVAQSAKVISELVRSQPSNLCRILRYERFVCHPKIARHAFEKLGWKFFGELTYTNDWKLRQHEVRRHGGRITDRSLRRRSTKLPREYQEYVDWVIKQKECREFQELFCYGTAR